MKPILTPSRTLVLALAGVLYLYPLTLGIPLLDPDEGLHAAIAQEMVERGDYVTPCLEGEPFFDKPVFFTWAQALSLRLFGMNEVGVRVPGMLFGLLGAVTTGLLAGVLFGRQVAPWGVLFYSTLVLPVALMQAAVHDVALVPMTNLALLFFWKAHAAGKEPVAWLHFALAGVMLGLACLTKGLIGVAIVGVVFLLYVLATRSLRVRTVLGGMLALVVAVPIAAPWFYAMEQRHPGYAYYYFVQRHFLGYVTDSQLHGHEPWWYYVPVFLGGALPWVVYLPPALLFWYRGAKLGERNIEKPLTFCWLWIAGGLLFLSAAHSKLLTYLSPVFPAVALIAAAAWASLFENSTPRTARAAMQWTLLLGASLAPIILPAAMLVTAQRFDIRFDIATWAVGLLISCAHWLTLPLWRQRSPRRALGTGVAVLALTFAFIMTTIVPHVAATVTAKPLAEYLNRRGRLPTRLLIVDERIGSLIFYLDPELRRQLRPGQICNVEVAEVVDPRNLPPDTLVAIPRKRHEVARRLLEKLPTEAVGHYDLVASAPAPIPYDVVNDRPLPEGSTVQPSDIRHTRAAATTTTLKFQRR